jgi:hypothetical protein
MTLAVVAYFEGAGETAGELTMPPPPGAALGEEWLGAGHVLLRRSIAYVSRVPEAAVEFRAPLRTSSGRLPRGSDFLHRRTLRQMLTWVRPTDRPDLVVVFVDADGTHDRKRTIEQHLEGLSTSAVVIGIPVQEFEAWLLADQAASGVHEPRAIESLNRREAKELLGDGDRKPMAMGCDLDLVARRCPAFDGFLGDLRRALLVP